MEPREVHAVTLDPKRFGISRRGRKRLYYTVRKATP